MNNIDSLPNVATHNNKSNIWLIIASTGVILTLLVLFAVYYFHSSNLISSDEHLIASLQNQISTMQGTIDTGTAQIKSLQNENSNYQTQIRTLQTENTGLNTQIVSLQSDNSGLKNDNASYKNQISSLQSQTTSLTTEVSSLKNQLTQSDTKLSTVSTQLNLYKDTYGSVVGSNIKQPAARVYLENNASATDPTWIQLRNFIYLDKTDQNTYILNSYDCKDFCRDVHNNAEKAGIRAGVAFISFKDEEIGHACNVFKTTDMGLVFIDCTGPTAFEDHPSNMDTTVGIKLGANYIPQFMFPEYGWVIRNMGVVSDVRIYW
jgi:hypothetical protein